jgi:hypothetical protein
MPFMQIFCFAYLADLPSVSLVRVFGVVLQSFRAGEFVIA